MKKIYLFSLLACLVFGSLAFVACGDDENDDNPEVPASGEQGNEQVDRIVGKWIWGEPNMPEGEETHHAAAYEFLADHTCYYYDRWFNYVDKAQVLEYERAYRGTYKVDGVKLTITWTSGRYYDAGSGERQLTSDDLGVENIEIMYPSEGGNVGVFFKRYNPNGGTSEEGPFYKAE